MNNIITKQELDELFLLLYIVANEGTKLFSITLQKVKRSFSCALEPVSSNPVLDVTHFTCDAYLIYADFHFIYRKDM